MTISVGQDQFKNIVEIWDAGPNTNYGDYS